MSLADERAGLGHNPDQQLAELLHPVTLEGRARHHESRRPGRLPPACSRDIIEPTTFRLRVEKPSSSSVPPRPVLAAHVSGVVQLSAFLTCRVTAGGMTKGMTRPTHGDPPNHGDLPIGIVWMSNG